MPTAPEARDDSTQSTEAPAGSGSRSAAAGLSLVAWGMAAIVFAAIRLLTEDPIEIVDPDSLESFDELRDYLISFGIGALGLVLVLAGAYSLKDRRVAGRVLFACAAVLWGLAIFGVARPAPDWYVGAPCGSVISPTNQGDDCRYWRSEQRGSTEVVAVVGLLFAGLGVVALADARRQYLSALPPPPDHRS